MLVSGACNGSRSSIKFTADTPSASSLPVSESQEYASVVYFGVYVVPGIKRRFFSCLVRLVGLGLVY